MGSFLLEIKSTKGISPLILVKLLAPALTSFHTESLINARRGYYLAVSALANQQELYHKENEGFCEELFSLPGKTWQIFS
jgi:hypothetical protein